MTKNYLAVPLSDPTAELLQQLETLQRATKGILARNLQMEGAADDVALRAIQQLSRLLGQQVDMYERVSALRTANDFDRCEALRVQAFKVLEKYPAASRALARALAGQGESE